MIRARDVMQTEVVVVHEMDSLEEVEKLFSEEAILGAPVLDADEEIIGMISASDLLREREAGQEANAPLSVAAAREADDELLPELARECVSDVMTMGVIKVPPNALIGHVARTLREAQVHRVVVMEEGKMVGLISTFDLLQVLEDELGG